MAFMLIVDWLDWFCIAVLATGAVVAAALLLAAGRAFLRRALG